MVNSLVDKARSMSSTITAATDDSPNCVSWNLVDVVDPKNGGAADNTSVAENSMNIESAGSSPFFAQCLDPSCAMLCEDTYQENEESESLELLDEGGGVENHEVEWKDVVSLLDGNEDDNNEGRDQDVSPKSLSTGGMKKLMSRGRLKKLKSPKLKNTLSARTFTFDNQDDKSVGVIDQCKSYPLETTKEEEEEEEEECSSNADDDSEDFGEATEVSYIKEEDDVDTSGRSKKTGLKWKSKLKSFSFMSALTFDKDDKSVVGLDQSKRSVSSRGSSKEEADTTNVDDTNHVDDLNVETADVSIGYIKEEYGPDADIESEPGSGDGKGASRVMKRLSSKVKLTPRLRSFISSRSILDKDVEVAEGSDCEEESVDAASILQDLSQRSKHVEDADESMDEAQPIENPVNVCESNSDDNLAIKKEVDGSIGCSFEVNDELKKPEADDVSNSDILKEDYSKDNDAEEEGFSISLRQDFQQSEQCVEEVEEDGLENSKTVSGIDDDCLDDEKSDFSKNNDVSFGGELASLNGDMSHMSKGCTSNAGSSASGLEMSLFAGPTSSNGGGSSRGGSIKGASEKSKDIYENVSAIKEQSTVEEKPQEKPFEFREMKVTLKFKAFAGVSQVTSRKNANNFQNGDGIDDTVKAVVTHRRNTIASDRFVSTHVPSLPIFLERTPDVASSQVYAQWPGGQQKDDDTASSSFLSSVTLVRTVRRVRNLENLSNGTTVGGSQIKHPKEQDSENFLASLSMAFAPELLDLQVGLLKGSGEIIPLGVATVVIPGEYKRMELDIPVVRNYGTGKHSPTSKKKMSSFRGKTNSSEDHVYFSADKDTKYKINEGSFLRLELNIEPAASVPATSLPPRHLNSNIRKTNFRSGPINQALRRRRKMDHLLTLQRIPLHQRIQLYLELRNRKSSNVNKASPNSQEIHITRQSEVSEVSCEVPPHIPEDSEADEGSASMKIEQYDMRHWATGEEESSKGSNSLLQSTSGPAPSVSVATSDVNQEDDMLDLVSKSSNVSANHSVQQGAPSSSHSASTLDSNMQVDIMTKFVPDTPNPSLLPEEEQAVSVGSLLAKEQDGRLSPESQYSEHGGGLTQFSSSLHSVFTTNHPQKQTVVQSLTDLLVCDSNIFLCDDERNALKYYTSEQEEKIARCCGVDDDYSLQDIYADDDTLASLDSLSMGQRRK